MIHSYVTSCMGEFMTPYLDYGGRRAAQLVPMLRHSAMATACLLRRVWKSQYVGYRLDGSEPSSPLREFLVALHMYAPKIASSIVSPTLPAGSPSGPPSDDDMHMDT
jgi:hypothetical protein